HPCARPSADRTDAAAPWRMGIAPHSFGGVDRADARTLLAQSAIRLSVVAEHGALPLPECIAYQLFCPWSRGQPDLDRTRTRHRRGIALDRADSDGRVYKTRDGVIPALITHRRRSRAVRS